MRKYQTCFLDMDGVLVDFVGGALPLLGFKDEARYLINDYNIDRSLCIPAGRTFSEVAKQDYNFWAELPKADTFLKALKVAGEVAESVVIVTEPCKGCENVSKLGKVIWLANNHLGHYPLLFADGILRSKMAIFRGARNILIDDYDVNLKRFRSEGGETIQVPRPWNSEGRGEFNLTVNNYLDFLPI